MAHEVVLVEDQVEDLVEDWVCEQYCLRHRSPVGLDRLAVVPVQKDVQG